MQFISGTPAKGGYYTCNGSSTLASKSKSTKSRRWRFVTSMGDKKSMATFVDFDFNASVNETWEYIIYRL